MGADAAPSEDRGGSEATWTECSVLWAWSQRTLGRPCGGGAGPVAAAVDDRWPGLESPLQPRAASACGDRGVFPSPGLPGVSVPAARWTSQSRPPPRPKVTGRPSGALSPSGTGRGDHRYRRGGARPPPHPLATRAHPHFGVTWLSASPALGPPAGHGPAQPAVSPTCGDPSVPSGMEGGLEDDEEGRRPIQLLGTFLICLPPPL